VGDGGLSKMGAVSGEGQGIQVGISNRETAVLESGSREERFLSQEKQ